MKRWLPYLLNLVLFSPGYAQGQKCFLWSLKNPDTRVYQDGALIPVHGTIDLSKHLYVNEARAMLHLQDENGKLFTVSFRNGKKVIVNIPGAEHSELYDIIVSDYLKNAQLLTSHLTAKPYDMDWFSYFSDFEQNPVKRLLIISDEQIPLKSKFITMAQGQELYARIIIGKASSAFKLNIKNGSLVLDKTSFGITAENDTGVFKWKLQLGYYADKKLLYTDLSEILTSRIIPLNELKAELDYFAANKSIPPGDLDQQLKLFLFLNYGKYNAFIVDPLIVQAESLR